MSGVSHETLFRCAWGNQRLILGPRAAVSRLDINTVQSQAEDASHILRSLIHRPGVSQSLRQCCLDWRMQSLPLWQSSDADLVTWLASHVRLGRLGVALLPDHAIVAGRFEGVEESRTQVLAFIRSALNEDPSRLGARKILAAIAPSQGEGGKEKAGSDRLGTMTLDERLIEVLHRTVASDLLSKEARQQLEAALSPEALATTVAVLAIWAGSHAIGAGFFIDLLLVGVGVYSVGTAAIEGIGKLLEFLSLTKNARSSTDLDKAANILAAAIALLGVTVLLRLIARGASGLRGAAKSRGVSKNKGAKTRSAAPKEGVEARAASKPSPPPKKPPAPPKVIPKKARDVAEHVAKKGSPPNGYVGGRVFKNLPGPNGKPGLPPGGNYREYDVDPKVPGVSRNAERIVIDANSGKVWYTDDHYGTFHEL